MSLKLLKVYYEVHKTPFLHIKHIKKRTMGLKLLLDSLASIHVKLRVFKLQNFSNT